MGRTLSLCLAVALVVIMAVNFLTMAAPPSVSPNTAAMTYTEWCQHMDQLTQNLQRATPSYWIRYSIELAVVLIGVVIFFRSLLRTGVWGWQQFVGGFLILAGNVDLFVYNYPSYSEALHDYKMWKEAGASHMWLYPCTASTGNR